MVYYQFYINKPRHFPKKNHDVIFPFWIKAKILALIHHENYVAITIFSSLKICINTTPTKPFSILKVITPKNQNVFIFSMVCFGINTHCG